MRIPISIHLISTTNHELISFINNPANIWTRTQRKLSCPWSRHYKPQAKQKQSVSREGTAMRATGTELCDTLWNRICAHFYFIFLFLSCLSNPWVSLTHNQPSWSQHFPRPFFLSTSHSRLADFLFFSCPFPNGNLISQACVYSSKNLWTQENKRASDSVVVFFFFFRGMQRSSSSAEYKK